VYSPFQVATLGCAIAQRAPHFARNAAGFLPCSCYEIYGGKVFDLLNGRAKLEVREDGRRQVQVVGLREVAIGCLTVLQQLCDHSAAARSTGSTGANDESSRCAPRLL
jgi:kinesin family protein 2/24